MSLEIAKPATSDIRSVNFEVLRAVDAFNQAPNHGGSHALESPDNRDYP